MVQNNYLGLLGYIKGQEIIKGTVDNNWGPSDIFEFTYTNHGAEINENNEVTFPEGSFLDINERFAPGDKAWEVSYTIRTGPAEHITDTQFVIFPTVDKTYFASGIVMGGFKWYVDLMDHPSWTIDSPPSAVLAGDTLYDIKVGYNKKNYYAVCTETESGIIRYNKEDGDSKVMYTPEDSHFKLGSDHNNRSTFQGILYLDTLKFKIFN